MKHIQSLAWMASATVLLAACSSTPVAKVEPMSQAPAAAPAIAPSANPAATTMSKVESVVVPPYLDPTNALAKERSFYFDYDNFAVKPEYSRQLELHGKFLASNPKVAIKIEGNADERGGSEYNLALGQKRAAAVATALKIYGVKDSQMEAISWGREKPKSTGHDEASWAKNRRADLVYPVK
jgi:peptidoglycan-associated lipoprotein